MFPALFGIITVFTSSLMGENILVRTLFSNIVHHFRREVELRFPLRYIHRSFKMLGFCHTFEGIITDLCIVILRHSLVTRHECLCFYLWYLCFHPDHLCGLVVRVPGYRSRDPGFDFQRCQIFEVVCLERGPLSLVSITEELFEWKSSGSGSRKSRLTAVGIRRADHATPSIHKSRH
jgi:hypothetical protein